MERRPVGGALLGTIALMICLGSCGKKEKGPSGQAVTGSADTLGKDVLSEEGFSNEAGASAGQLVLPTSFGRRTGDLDQMLKARAEVHRTGNEAAWSDGQPLFTFPGCRNVFRR